MATPNIRHKRILLMSAPPLNRLPRIDSSHLRRELTLSERRQGTARLRRYYQNSRQNDYIEDTTRRAEIEKLKEYKKYLDNMKILNRNNKEKDSPRKEVEESIWQREVTKIDIPERLPIAVPVRLRSAQGPPLRSEHLPNTNSMFYRVSISAKKPSGSTVIEETKPNLKQKLQYFINQDWSSERVSWNHFHKNVPEFQKTSWIC